MVRLVRPTLPETWLTCPSLWLKVAVREHSIATAAGLDFDGLGPEIDDSLRILGDQAALRATAARTPDAPALVDEDARDAKHEHLREAGSRLNASMPAPRNSAVIGTPDRAVVTRRDTPHTLGGEGDDANGGTRAPASAVPALPLVVAVDDGHGRRLNARVRRGHDQPAQVRHSSDGGDLERRQDGSVLAFG